MINLKSPEFASRSSLRFAVLAAVLGWVCLGAIGCGSSQPATGTPAPENPQIKEANQNMENFMNSQKSQGKGAGKSGS